MIPVFSNGASDAQTMLRLREDSGFWTHHFPRAQRAPAEVQSKPPERAHYRKGFGEAGARLHALSSLRQGSESHLGERDCLDFHQHFLRQPRDLNGRPRGSHLAKILLID